MNPTEEKRENRNCGKGAYLMMNNRSIFGICMRCNRHLSTRGRINRTSLCSNCASYFRGNNYSISMKRIAEGLRKAKHQERERVIEIINNWINRLSDNKEQWFECGSPGWEELLAKINEAEKR